MSFNPYQTQIDRLTAELAEAQELAHSSADPELQELAAQEIRTLETQLQTLQNEASEYEANIAASDDVPEGEHVNCVIELRAGVGGDEATIWANDILRMYIRFIEKLGFKLSYIDDLVIKVEGRTPELPELAAEGKRTTAYQVFQYESGVHRVQRVPATESSGRIHTSTCTVAVLPEVPTAAVEIRDEDLEWQFMRSSGAGGQSVNKTSSAVRLIHAPSGIAVTARQEKKQEQNRKSALDLLRSQLWEIEEEKRLAQIGSARSAIGGARRSEKIRTYNFPQNRITDHRTKQSWHNLPGILDGAMEDMVLDVHTAFTEEESTGTEE